MEQQDWSLLRSQLNCASTGLCQLCNKQFNLMPDRPVIQIQFQHGTWWQLPTDMSDQVLARYQANEIDIGYTWDWGDTRVGSWQPDDETTSINRYTLNFDTWEQTNIDSQRKRNFRIAWVCTHGPAGVDERP